MEALDGGALPASPGAQHNACSTLRAPPSNVLGLHSSHFCLSIRTAYAAVRMHAADTLVLEGDEELDLETERYVRGATRASSHVAGWLAPSTHVTRVHV